MHILQILNDKCICLHAQRIAKSLNGLHVSLNYSVAVVPVQITLPSSKLDATPQFCSQQNTRKYTPELIRYSFVYRTICALAWLKWKRFSSSSLSNNVCFPPI